MEGTSEKLEKDPDFSKQIKEKGGINLYTCIQCGTCSGSCPGGKVTAYRTRMIIRNALVGLKSKVLSSDEIWLCTTCRICASRCPRGIDVTKAILTIRNMAVDAGYALKAHKILATQAMMTGCALGGNLNETIQELRHSLGLSRTPISITYVADPKPLADFRRLISEVGLDKLMQL